MLGQRALVNLTEIDDSFGHSAALKITPLFGYSEVSDLSNVFSGGGTY